ncbi:Bug family tripartite tricarboxylate transporter substrate binding protein [Aquibacillus sediminis]|uniref:Bug family tripartite tricarboxylate transporter substrate binding protein n=1 Tax=Aquibacillus sediminis TaxID=2574734 RepID=UPI0014862E6C|nr:tripartite tricarboxylate transporter substrate binding protein [Aquibacillus sediminis]
MKKIGMKSIVTAFIMSIILAGCGGSSGDSASNYPEESVKIIVPFAAGGGATTTARTISEYAEDHVGESLVIENREGGGGSAGQQYVASADNDGYTLLLITGSAVTNPIFNKTSFTYEDFEPVIQLVSDVSYLYVNADAPYDDLESFAEYAKDNPGEVTISTSGAQASDHYAALEIIEELGLDAEAIPYDGESQAIASTSGGHDEATIGNFAAAEGQVQSGNLKPLVVLGDEQTDVYPDVPTSIEEGLEVTEASWRGIAAPKGTPSEIIEHLHEAFKKGFDDEDYQNQMSDLGMDTEYKGPEDFQDRVVEYYERMSQATE